MTRNQEGIEPNPNLILEKRSIQTNPSQPPIQKLHAIRAEGDLLLRLRDELDTLLLALAMSRPRLHPPSPLQAPLPNHISTYHILLYPRLDPSRVATDLESLGTRRNPRVTAPVLRLHQVAPRLISRLRTPLQPQKSPVQDLLAVRSRQSKFINS